LTAFWTVHALHDVPPIGGGWLDIHHTTLQLLALGHQCEVIASLKAAPRLLTYRVCRLLSGRRPIGLRDRRNGYTTRRAIDWVVPHLLRRHLEVLQPHVVMTQGVGREELAHEAVRLGYPTMIRLVTVGSVDRLTQTVQGDAECADMVRNPLLLIVSNSHFIATRVRHRLGLESPVVYPLIRFDHCAVSQRQAECVTFVNPAPVKGLETALRVASLLPHRRFLFIESWPLSRAAYSELRRRLKGLPNVHFRRRTLHMRDVYGRTAVLLVPSQCEEAFGRVVIEAARNGIPVVASRVGGIPEATGDSGVLLSPADPPERWAETIEQILSDKGLYAQLGRRAVLHAGDARFSPNDIAQRFLSIAEEHRRRRSA
jgi:glycosyltransferase involved in cell wall biosynthesis